MRRQAVSLWSGCSPSLRQRINLIEPIGRRYVRIFATPSSSGPAVDELNLETDTSTASPDAKFEVLGAPFSLLSVQLSPSQNLYTRRGTLVALSGKAENAVSTLSLLSPFTRSLLGIPFLYQKISSASPITALISTKSPLTSFAVVHLDGRLDWLITQRSALLAWTGHALTVKPRMNTRLSLQHWGNTITSGRGLVALVGKGQIYQISLKAGEEYVAHPSNVVAYTQNAHPPQPYRFRSTTLNLQIPSITAFFPDTKFFNELKKSATWKFLANSLFRIRTWTRRNIWGDRLFLQFKGPTTLLLQSRGARLSDSLTVTEVNEIADAPAGVVAQAVTLDVKKESVEPYTSRGKSEVQTPIVHESKSEKISFATVRSGKVGFSKDEVKV